MDERPEACPACRGTVLIRSGHTCGRQRWKCKGPSAWSAAACACSAPTTTRPTMRPCRSGGTTSARIRLNTAEATTHASGVGGPLPAADVRGLPLGRDGRRHHGAVRLYHCNGGSFTPALVG